MIIMTVWLEQVLFWVGIPAALFFMMYMYLKDRRKSWIHHQKRWKEFEDWESKQKEDRWERKEEE